MASTGVVADSFGGPSRGKGGSTPPDYYSTFMSMRGKAKPQQKPNISDDETQKALTAVMQVFEKLEAKDGGKKDPNLDAARDAIKKFAASKKIDPQLLTGETKSPAPAAEGAAPPPADTQPPPAPGSADASQEAPTA